MSTSENVFWVPAAARWDVLLRDAKQATIWQTIDAAMDLVEKENPSLKGVLPKNYGRADLDKRLGELVDLIGSIGFTNVDHGADDMPGKVYEYFLGKFAGQEGRGAGEIYTPRSVVRLLVEMIEPYPCESLVAGVGVGTAAGARGARDRRGRGPGLSWRRERRAGVGSGA